MGKSANNQYGGDLRCLFCNEPRSEGKVMISGDNGAYICNECVEECLEKLRAYDQSQTASGGDALPTPMQMKRALDDYVIGQEQVKKMLAVAVYNHYKRRKYREGGGKVELSKANVLLIGPTGSGKTLLAQTLARILDVPLVIVDATTLTEAGYVGEDVENIIQRLMQRSDYDMERVVRGIIYIDEIDKIARKSENPSITRDVSGEGVQQALLKLIEGTIASVPPQGGRKHPHQEYVQVDTTEILFICGGAFDGLANIINRRKKQNLIGFNDDAAPSASLSLSAAVENEILPEDLIAFGLIPELVGRLPVVGVLDNLGAEALKEIFVRPRNALAKQYTEIFSVDGAELTFTPDGVAAIVELARERGTGARGLRAVAEEVLMNLMFSLPEMKSVTGIIVDANAVHKRRPMLVMKNGARKRMPLKDAA